MGRKLDALLGRNFKTKSKALAKLTISRVAILKNQHQVRCSNAISDVKELLNLDQQQHALRRVEHVIKEQNMLDVYAMIEYYCKLLLERANFIQKNKECADDLKEIISSLIFAVSRCGEFPELQEMRVIFTSAFGEEFAARAVELRNNCEVNPKMIQRLSKRQPSLESRLKVLKEIASESGITLQLEEDSKEKLDVDKNQKLKEQEPSIANEPELNNETYTLHENIKQDEKFSESMKGRKNYSDVAVAAQEAFESAAHAAAAAREAVELSKSDPQNPDDQNGSNHHGGTTSGFDDSTKIQNDSSKAPVETEHLDSKLGLNKIHFDPVDNLSDSENEEGINNNCNIRLQRVAENKIKQEIDKKLAALNKDKMVHGVNVDGLSDEDSVNLPYQSPKRIPRKPQAVRGTPRLERSHHFTSAENLHKH